MPRHYIGERTVHGIRISKNSMVLRIAETSDHLHLHTCAGERLRLHSVQRLEKMYELYKTHHVSR